MQLWRSLSLTPTVLTRWSPAGIQIVQFLLEVEADGDVLALGVDAAVLRLHGVDGRVDDVQRRGGLRAAPTLRRDRTEETRVR